MRRSSVALRLQASILEEARGVSETEAVALNQFFNVAVAEKLSALRTEEFFRERGTRGYVGKAPPETRGSRKRSAARRRTGLNRSGERDGWRASSPRDDQARLTSPGLLLRHVDEHRLRVAGKRQWSDGCSLVVQSHIQKLCG
jgi:hypothetical protein